MAGLGMVTSCMLKGTLRGYVIQMRRVWLEETQGKEEAKIGRRLKELGIEGLMEEWASQRLDSNVSAMRAVAMRVAGRIVNRLRSGPALRGLNLWRSKMNSEAEGNKAYAESDKLRTWMLSSMFGDRLVRTVKVAYPDQPLHQRSHQH